MSSQSMNFSLPTFHREFKFRAWDAHFFSSQSKSPIIKVTAWLFREAQPRWVVFWQVVHDADYKRRYLVSFSSPQTTTWLFTGHLWFTGTERKEHKQHTHLLLGGPSHTANSWHRRRTTWINASASCSVSLRLPLLMRIIKILKTTRNETLELH